MYKRSSVFLFLLISGCTGPSLFYTPQGNLLNQDSVRALFIGQTQEEVIRLLGEPILDSLDKENHWIYVTQHSLIRHTLFLEFDENGHLFRINKE